MFFPKENLIEPCASASSTPIESRTCDGSSEPEEQAEPEETDMPAIDVYASDADENEDEEEFEEIEDEEEFEEVEDEEEFEEIEDEEELEEVEDEEEFEEIIPLDTIKASNI